MEVILLKSPTGSLIPVDDEQAESLKRFKSGSMVRGEFKLMQNGAFHRKMMSLLNLCYEQFKDRVDTGVEYQGQLVKPCFDTWRQHFTILAGHFDVVFDWDGKPTPKARSLSFAKCSPEEREQVYSDFISAALKHIYHGEMSEARLRNIVDQILAYA
jgi:hypothetical protein